MPVLVLLVVTYLPWSSRSSSPAGRQTIVEKFFASCPRGSSNCWLEDLVAAGARDLKQIFGGVHFLADWPACYRANLHSRIATRILWRVALAPYGTEEDIYRLALDTPWPKWFVPEQTIRVDVNAVKSPLKSLDFVTLRIKDAVCDRFRPMTGTRPSVDTRQPEVRVHGFISKDECTLYLDTSGAPLYQRGFRQKTVDAPLKENLAAGILRLSGWQPASLCSTRCAAAVPSCSRRHRSRSAWRRGRAGFRFQQLRHFDAAAWQRLLDAARATKAGCTARREFSAAISRRLPFARRWPTSTAPDCCRQSPEHRRPARNQCARRAWHPGQQPALR
jgi:putative N6-adenine-specific DNA methylase